MNPKKLEQSKVVRCLWSAGLVAALSVDLACFVHLDDDLMSSDSQAISLVAETGPQPDGETREDPAPDLTTQVSISDLGLQDDAGAVGHDGSLADAGAADLTSPSIDAAPPDLTSASPPIDASPPDHVGPSVEAQTPPAAPSPTVVINEIYPGAGLDWFELLNRGSQPVDLSGHLITDLSNVAVKFPAGTTILPGEYRVFSVSGVPGWPGFKLSKSGESLLLLDGSSKQVDLASWGAVPDTKSWARVPDGTGAFQISAITKGAANQNPGSP